MDFNAIDVTRKLTALAGPPGQEAAVRDWLVAAVKELGFEARTDPKGNVVVEIVGDRKGCPDVLVTAHMDEIALMVTKIEDDGRIRVAPLGGAYAWKWGEIEVEILARGGPVTGILSYGCIHTNSADSVVQHARGNALEFDRAYVFTGLDSSKLAVAGVRPGCRVVVAPGARPFVTFGEFVAAYFIDDRADLAVWLLALQHFASNGTAGIGKVTFAATTSEEVGADGAQYLLRTAAADVCVALEIGPKTPEADFAIDANPTIWVRDGYAAMEAVDGDILTDCCAELSIHPHWQYLSRGGSDASCAACKGLTARPVTLGIPVENSHGLEIMHRNAPEMLLKLLIGYLGRVA